MPNIFVKEASTLRRVKYAYAYDTLGIRRRIVRAYAFDADGNRQQIFPQLVQYPIGLSQSFNDPNPATGELFIYKRKAVCNITHALGGLTRGYIQSVFLGSISPDPTNLFGGYLSALYSFNSGENGFRLRLNGLPSDPGVSAIRGILHGGILNDAGVAQPRYFTSYTYNSGEAEWRYAGDFLVPSSGTYQITVFA